MREQTPIESLSASAWRVPNEGGPESDGTLTWADTEFVVVELEAAGERGMGYSYTAAAPARALIEGKLAEVVCGEDVFDIPRLWRRMNEVVRNVGRPGLGMMSIAAVDVALWDLKARLLGVPLATLWGRARSSVPAYASGGFVNMDDRQLASQLEHWRGSGFEAIKIKIGNGVEDDARRVARARDVIGGGVRLMVDANGAYDVRTALALIERLRPYDVSWLEEPVSSDDLPGLAWLRDRAPVGMAIAAGEYGWDVHYFRHMLEAGAVDVLQADATRCGYTGFLEVSALGTAFFTPLSAHCAPALHAPICQAAPMLRHMEYFHDHVRIESMLFQGTPEARAGSLESDPGAAGHGLALDRGAAEPYRL